MNFSNFIIDKLTDADSAYSLGSKKNAANPFLFSDIIKVCEQENENQISGSLDTAVNEESQEMFSVSENVVNLEGQDFFGLVQQITDLIKGNAQIQPTETSHKVENADISKFQFVVSEEELVELAGDFIEKTGYSLIPISNLSESNSGGKPLTITYKSGVNKLSIAISQIKVDENSTNKAIQDDFNFVNKLLVDERLIQSISASNSKSIAANDKSDDEQKIVSEPITEDEDIDHSLAKLFYKAEIIKIESPYKNNEVIYSYPTENNNINFGFSDAKLSLLENNAVISNNQTFKNQLQNSAVSESIDVNDAVKTLHEPKITKSLDNVKVTNTAKDLLVSLGNTKTVESETSSTELNKGNNVIDLNKLMEGLTEEEKSVFKNFRLSGELKEISYTKASISPDNIKTKPTENVLGTDFDSKQTVQETKSKQQTLFSIECKDFSESILGTDFDLKQTAQVTKSKQQTLLSVEYNSVDFAIKNKTNTESGEIYYKTEITNQQKTADSIEGKLETINKEEFSSIESKLAGLGKTIDLKTLTAEKFNLNSSEDIKSINTVEGQNIVELEDTRVKDHARADLDEKAFEVKSESNLHVKVFNKNSYKIDNENPNLIRSKQDDVNNNTEYVQNQKESKNSVDEIKFIYQDNSGKNLFEPKKSSSVENGTTAANKAIEINDAEKINSENKEQLNIQSKDVKTSAENQHFTHSDNENSKSSTSDNFKAHLTQSVNSEKVFDLENLKPQPDQKHTNEIFKTVKQNEILPELSKMVLQGEKQTMTLQLTPENLGKVKLTVDMIENQIVTKIEVESEQVKQFVQSNLEHLKQSMQSAGITLTNVNVSLSDDQKNPKLFTQKKKNVSRDEKEEILEEVTQLSSKKKMGYNTYEFTA